MINIFFYQDTRRKTKDELYPVKLVLSHKGVKTHMATGIRISVGDFENVRTGNVTTPALNRTKNQLERIRLDAEDMVIVLNSQGVTPTPSSIKDALLDKADPSRKEQRERREKEGLLLTAWFHRRMELKSGKTLDSIRQTLAKIEAFDPGAALDGLSPAWLQRLDAFMAKTSPSANARAVHMRNLRAVINFAIDEGATDNYPFRRYRIKTVKTAKRSLSAEQLRAFFSLDVPPSDRKYLDLFKLSFLLVGINSVDILNLRPCDLCDGRVTYNRSKTKRLYSIKVEPEALEIIERYRGVEHLIDPLDRCSNWEHYRKRMNKALSAMGETTIGKHGKKVREPMFPDITTYWARHSWATIAASLDIPKDTIAAALGHGGNTVTDIYIDFDRKKVDDANRRVIDWVLYGKK